MKSSIYYWPSPTRIILNLFSIILAVGIVILMTTSSSIAQDSDTTPPQLVNFSFSPSTVDVSDGPQTITATFEVTDDLAGVSYAWVMFRSPSNIQYQYLYANTLTSGDTLNGTLEGTLAIPQFSENGTWTVTSVGLWDLTGNNTYIDNTTLQSLGFPTALIVTSNPMDRDGPILTGLNISPNTVDVSGGPQEITINLNLTDNLSGVFLKPPVTGGGITFFAAEFVSPSGQQSRFLSNWDFTLISGTSLDGTWQATFTMPQFSEPGEWQIANVYVYDLSANNTFLWTSQLQNMGFTTGINVTSSPSDLLPPELTDFSFLPNVINTSSNFQNVTVNLNIQDALSGVDFSTDATYIGYFFGVLFRSPSGQQYSSAWLNLASGDSINGTWTGSAYFPRYSEDGTWRVWQVIVKDAKRNIFSLDNNALQTMGFPTNLVVIRPSLVGDGTISDPLTGGTIMDDTFGDRAQVTFPPGSLSQPTNVSIDVFQDPLDIPMPSGYLSPGTLFVNIDLTPVPSFPLSPPGLTIVLPLPNPLPAGTPLDLYRVDPGTGDLVPSLDVFNVPVVGTVDLDGLSATFTGIAHLSTVVGLIPESSDRDSDGISDEFDDCPESNLNNTVVIDSCDSGVRNTLLESGCTISDMIAGLTEGSGNHGDFVNSVSHMTNGLKKANIITGTEKGAIQSCAAKSDTH